MEKRRGELGKPSSVDAAPLNPFVRARYDIGAFVIDGGRVERSNRTRRPPGAPSQADTRPWPIKKQTGKLPL